MTYTDLLPLLRMGQPLQTSHKESLPMPAFSDILPTLSPIDHIASLTLSGPDGTEVLLENKPGTAGSVRVYHEVSKDSGQIDAAAAQKALELYAEHTEDARENPGKHPNIDRLFQLIADDQRLRVTVNPAPSSQS